MIDNTLHLPTPENSLTAKVNGIDFKATIVGGRYDKELIGDYEWNRRSWGAGLLLPTDKTLTLVFISIAWDIPDKNTYDLSDDRLPVSIGFTNLYPTSGGDEFAFLIYAQKGSLTITHSKETYIAEGCFSFEVDVDQPDGTSHHFMVTEGSFYVAPTDDYQ
ncbi:hypothetical protein [Pseudomonas aeruginosa]|uniref:hypothetical protein n=1 Tax=Pseudomonas aeruginosa TaxID=287 RepID=UPI00224C7F23|nr:hypothetical protein [Pseudomonas aeruginosa]MCX4212298.1 hypothetical protein [Pseudomonas aeruginosa]MCX4231133.1 hypothetical protein [Pseudomonas aeruginosa]